MNFQIFSQDITDLVLYFEGTQNNLPLFKISKPVPFLLKEDYFGIEWILVKDGNINAFSYDKTSEELISSFEITESTNYGEFDIGFGSKDNKGYYILVFRNGSDIYVQSDSFSDKIKVNRNFLGRNPKIAVLYDNSFFVIYTCYLANIRTSSI